MALMTCAEFRVLRDRFALDGYHVRWPILNGKKQALTKQIETIDTKLKSWVLTSRGKEAFMEERYALMSKRGQIIGEMATMEADAPIRKMNLGLIPVPADPSPELKMRLTVFIIELSRDMLMKGIPV